MVVLFSQLSVYDTQTRDREEDALPVNQSIYHPHQQLPAGTVSIVRALVTGQGHPPENHPEKQVPYTSTWRMFLDRPSPQGSLSVFVKPKEVFSKSSVLHRYLGILYDEF